MITTVSMPEPDKYQAIRQFKPKYFVDKVFIIVGVIQFLGIPILTVLKHSPGDPIARVVPTALMIMVGGIVMAGYGLFPETYTSKRQYPSKYRETKSRASVRKLAPYFFIGLIGMFATSLLAVITTPVPRIVLIVSVVANAMMIITWACLVRVILAERVETLFRVAWFKTSAANINTGLTEAKLGKKTIPELNAYMAEQFVIASAGSMFNKEEMEELIKNE